MFNSVTKYLLITLGCIGVAVSGPEYLGFRACKDQRTKLAIANPQYVEKPVYCTVSESILAWKPKILDEDIFFFGSIVLIALGLVLPVHREWDGNK